MTLIPEYILEERDTIEGVEFIKLVKQKALKY